MKTLERVLNVVFVVAVVAMAGAVVQREIVGTRRPSHAPPPMYHPDWRSFLHSGRLLTGSAHSPVQVIEFLDLECPACRQFQPRTLAKIETAYRDSVAITIIHYPLRGHRFAKEAAQASECAAEQGRFPTFIDLALVQQDSFGLKPWRKLAAEANVADVKRFSDCLDRGGSPLVEAGLALANRVGIEGTPTVLVNGWEFPGAPDEKTLRDEIHAILSGKARPLPVD